jgi:flagella basal body P-ring formation protein FlgA
MYGIILTILLAFSSIAALAEEIPAANTLAQEQVEEAAASELASKGAGGRVQAILTGQKSRVLYESTKPLAAKITGIHFDKRTRRWSGNLLVMSGEQVLSALPVGGRYEETVLLPVLKRQLRAGEMIKAEDIDMLDFPIGRTRGDSLTDASQLVGYSPRAAISPMRPVRGTEIASPALVKKNSMVTMRYVSGGMEITTTGQAMADGAKGELIEVKNLTSKTLVHAVVENERGVLISPPGEQLAGGASYVAN